MTRLPERFDLVLDRSVRSYRNGTVLVGGHPGRLMTLTGAGIGALVSLFAGAPHRSEEARELGGRLVEAGMAHPVRPPPGRAGPGRPSVTVVVPAHDRTAMLGQCLASLGTEYPVVVVDDASSDATGVARVAATHGATVVRRAVNGGPGAARNEAVTAVATEWVAFVDSDCTVPVGWLSDLDWLCDDPAIAAVAPRIRPHRTASPTGDSALARYAEARSSLDLGPEPGEVGPDRLVRYVPTAALVIRRSALAEGFDPDLRVGEDVDLIWRLVGDGWRVRYEPSVVVHHHEPTTWWALLGRRFRYGTSAGPLARRHRAGLAPLELRAWPALVAGAALVGLPRITAVLLVASTGVLARTVAGHGIPVGRMLAWSAGGAAWTLVGAGRATTELAGPVVLVAAVLAGPSRARAVLRRPRVVVTTALLVLVPPAVEWVRRRPRLGPISWSVASLADDAAYGAGVWTGCLRARSWRPLVPSVRTR